ncbi:MAG: SDR family NAD(P)-dependent oxidoreductase [Ginsengibacter sp.]
MTGANSGIGEGVAIALGDAGANVIVNYVVKPDEANAVVEKIKAGGSDAIALQADVSKEDQVIDLRCWCFVLWVCCWLTNNNAKRSNVLKCGDAI